MPGRIFEDGFVVMSGAEPKNANAVRKIVKDRLEAVLSTAGAQETVTIEWRGEPKHIPVIKMPIDLLSYNPNTHRIRAQRSLNPERDRELDSDPFSASAQAYLHELLRGDPADPSKVDPSFEGLRDDLSEHGQTEPGIITTSGVLINGNTRRAAMKELGKDHIRVGVLPSDAAHDDLMSIELSLQLRKDHRRDYSFMNFLLAIDERIVAGRPATEIQRDFRIKPATYERSIWILSFVREAIARSRIVDSSGNQHSMRLIDFEIHQGKLEELYRSYSTLKQRSVDDAEALREQRLLAIAFDKSKTDLRYIEPDFSRRFMKSLIPQDPTPGGSNVKIPGTTIVAPGPNSEVRALRALTTEILQSRALVAGSEVSSTGDAREAKDRLDSVEASLDRALEQAGKYGRVLKRRLAAADRLGDARDDLELAIQAVAESRSTSDFRPDDIDEVLVEIGVSLKKLAQQVQRSGPAEGEGLEWLRRVGSIFDA